jgi:transcription elongation GreA/GreB family factor
MALGHSHRRWRGLSEAARKYLSIRSWCHPLRPHTLATLFERMERRKLGDNKPASAGIDSRVWLLDLDYRGEVDFVLVEPGRACPENRVISILSPFGEALFGARVGDVVHPRFLGHEYSVLITKIESCAEDDES